MSTIDFQCPGCGRRFSVPADQAGRKGGCRHCNIFFLIPSASASVPAAPVRPDAAPAPRPEIRPQPEFRRAPQPGFEPLTISHSPPPARVPPRMLAFREAPPPPPPPRPPMPTSGGGSKFPAWLGVMLALGLVRFLISAAGHGGSSAPYRDPMPSYKIPEIRPVDTEQLRKSLQKIQEDSRDRMLRDALERSRTDGGESLRKAFERLRGKSGQPGEPTSPAEPNPAEAPASDGEPTDFTVPAPGLPAPTVPNRKAGDAPPPTPKLPVSRP